MDALKDLELLIRSRTPIIAVETCEEDRVEEVLLSLAARLSVPLFLWTVSEGLRRSGAGNQIYDTQDPGKALANLAAIKEDGIFFFKDLHHYLDHPEVVRRVQDLSSLFSKSSRALILSAPRIDLPAELESLTATFKLDLPGADELWALVKDVLTELAQTRKIRAQLSGEERARLLESLKGLTLQEARRALTMAILEDGALTGSDVQAVLEIKKERLRKEGILDFLTPEDCMADVGGLENLKSWLQKRRRAFTAEARKFGIPHPKGIILLGVQGCGKSLAAKAVAHEWSLPLLKMEPGRLYGRFIGESEENLEKALGVAERMAPCVLMVDEIEKGFASVSSSETDAGLSKRIFGRLLGWLQDRPAPVFVAATCNDISQLPPEMMRKGRFDEIFFLDLPKREERKEIFALHLRKRGRDPAAFDLDALAAASDGFSGSEIEQAIVSALYTAFSRSGDITTIVIVEELRATKPLSVARAEEIEALRQWAAGRAVMAN